MSLRLSRPVDTLLRHADEDLNARTALINGDRDTCTDSLTSLDTCLRDFLAEKGSEGR